MKGSRLFVASLILAPMFVAALPSRAQSAEPVEPAPTISKQPQTIIVPDGTPVRLRFAEPVVGYVASHRHHTRKGVTVRLVVASDVRVNDKVAIAKGSLAHATVMKVWDPGFSPVVTGLSLRMDWVTTVTGDRVPLRAVAKGAAEPFDVEALATNGGVEVAPCEKKKRWLGNIFLVDAFTGRAYHSKNWIPTGSRMTAYLDGDNKFQVEAFEQAASELPVANSTATLYVFRNKSKHGISPVVACGTIEIGAISSRQMAMVDLTPGLYDCKVGTSAPTQITVEKGNDYYLWLRPAGREKWELRAVKSEEGEDRSAESELLPELPTK